MRGYIQLVADGDVHAWNAELDGKGKAIREEVGAVLADHGASFAARPAPVPGQPEA